MEKTILIKPRMSGKSTSCINYTELFKNSIIISINKINNTKSVSVESFIKYEYNYAHIDTIIIDDYLFISYENRLKLHSAIERNKNIKRLIIVSSLNGPICNKNNYLIIRSLKQYMTTNIFNKFINDIDIYNRNLANNFLNIYNNYLSDNDADVIFDNKNLNKNINLEKIKKIISEKEFNNQYLNKFDE